VAYNENIPASTDQLKVSQADILANFQALKTLIDVNHETFGAAGEGKHKFLQMPRQLAAPTTAADEAGFFGARGATSGVMELFFRRENDGIKIPFTSGTRPVADLANGQGYSYLGSGVCLLYGSAAVASVPGGTKQLISIDLTVAGPALTFIGPVYTQASFPGSPPVGNYSLSVDYSTTTAASLKLYLANEAALTATGAFKIFYFVIGATNLT